MDVHSVKIPGPDHPIAIEPHHSRVVVTVAGETIADSRNVLTLREGSYPPVHYIPRADVDMAHLARSTRTSHCPYKGQASYYSIPAGGDRSRDAIWTYEDAYPAVAAIRGHLAFYPDRVDAIDIRPA
ncbi:DUF427 domain-containing protein [Lichenifustis flavocetrariae]|uniref:DUF427 domain-containing protein n=1 Tax=Lichenifustis flavocetrariae TaxID=2949735 RepID=A0AA41YZY7_9HYPH|nr:DUF427 domain-containing protein [Lichenifustis flavocetrariae]MCW6511229.1 DUF427 domain-containing protein [Lichenifustis flavocetrariae]